MITKGIVEEIVSPYKAKVRLPIFDGIEGSQTALSTKDLSAATICTLPNLTSVVSVGDIVYVGFEDDDIARPVILGHLSKESGTDTKAILTLDGLNVEGITQLSEQTNIGKVKPTEIARLTGVKANVQDQLNNLSQYTPLLSELEINTRNLLILEDSDTLSAGISIRTSFADQSFSISGRNETMFEFTADVPIKPIQLTKDTEYLFSLQNISNAIPTVTLDLRSSNSALYIEPGRPYKATDNVIIDKLHVTVFGTRQISSTLYMMFEQGSTLHSWVKPGGLVYSTDTRLQDVAHTIDPEIVFAENERQKSKNLFKVDTASVVSSGITYTANANTQTITISGTTEVSYTRIAASGYEILEKGKVYTISGHFTSTQGIAMYLHFSDDTFQTVIVTNKIGVVVYAPPTQKVISGIAIEMYNKTFNNDVLKIQVEHGDVATDWQYPYGAIVHEKVIDGFKEKVLWTNPNPKSPFSSQTISLASSDYNILLCYVSLYAESSKNPRIFSVECEKGNNIVLNIAADYSGKFGTFYREGTYVSDTQLNITGGSYQTSSGLGTDNSICVPVKIIGYKRG